MKESQNQKGQLDVVALCIKLPCQPSCPYKRDCATQFRANNCRGRINSFIKANIYGTPGRKSFKDEAIEFKTKDPEGQIVIKDGIAGISR